MFRLKVCVHILNIFCVTSLTKRNVRSHLQSPWQQDSMVGVEPGSRPHSATLISGFRTTKAARFHCHATESRLRIALRSAPGYSLSQRHIRTWVVLLRTTVNTQLQPLAWIWWGTQEQEWAGCVGMDLHIVPGFSVCEQDAGEIVWSRQK